MQKTWIGVHMIDGLAKSSVVEEAKQIISELAKSAGIVTLILL